MAITVTSAFQIYKRNLEITDLQSETASKRQNRIRESLKGKLNVVDSFLTGSYMRNTMIAPLKSSDIDIFTVLDSSYFYKYSGPTAILDLVKRNLLATYRTPKVSRNGQAVTITFEDFMVDVVPSFLVEGGGYYIPDSTTNDWIHTDPKFHIKHCSELNALNSGKLVPLIKMIKSWNRNNGGFFRSFHLEVLAYSIFQYFEIKNYQEGLNHFFIEAEKKVVLKNPDPSGYSEDVGSYINSSNILNATSKFKKAAEKSNKALIHEILELNRLAIEEWKNLLGDKFPSYG